MSATILISNCSYGIQQAKNHSDLLPVLIIVVQ